MRYLLIDPPVGPYNPATDIKAWFRALERMKHQFPRSQREIQRSIHQAVEWLELADSRG
jgi:hypothetical protein